MVTFTIVLSQLRWLRTCTSKDKTQTPQSAQFLVEVRHAFLDFPHSKQLFIEHSICNVYHTAMAPSTGLGVCLSKLLLNPEYYRSALFAIQWQQTQKCRQSFPCTILAGQLPRPSRGKVTSWKKRTNRLTRPQITSIIQLQSKAPRSACYSILLGYTQVENPTTL